MRTSGFTDLSFVGEAALSNLNFEKHRIRKTKLLWFFFYSDDGRRNKTVRDEH
jgi:hypothetical protein